MEIEKRESIYDDLSKYDYLSKDNEFIEVTRWTSGEGWDININDKLFSITEGQLDAINYLVNVIRFERNKR